MMIERSPGQSVDIPGRIASLANIVTTDRKHDHTYKLIYLSFSAVRNIEYDGPYFSHLF